MRFWHLFNLLSAGVMLLLSCESIQTDKASEKIILNYRFDKPLEECWPFIMNVLFKEGYEVQDRDLLVLRESAEDAVYLDRKAGLDNKYFRSGWNLLPEYPYYIRVYVHAVRLQDGGFRLICSKLESYEPNRDFIFYAGPDTGLFLKFVEVLEPDRYAHLKYQFDMIRQNRDRNKTSDKKKKRNRDPSGVIEYETEEADQEPDD